MLSDYELSFQSGSIISGELLEKMYTQPKNLINLIFSDKSDGVISGMNPYNSEDDLFISNGIYKYRGKIYALLEDEKIELSNGVFKPGIKYCTYLSTSKIIKQTNNIHINVVNIVTVSENELPVNAEIMFSFFGSPILPKFCEYVLSPNFDLLSYKKSMYGSESTFSPYVFLLIKNMIIDLCAKNLKTLHALDYILINEISCNGCVSIEFIKKYIFASGTLLPEYCDKYVLFSKFIEAIKCLTGAFSSNNAYIQDDSQSSGGSIWF